jgi:hypothetical protein
VQENVSPSKPIFTPVPHEAPHVSAEIIVLSFPAGQRPKATDVSPWYRVHFPLMCFTASVAAT